MGNDMLTLSKATHVKVSVRVSREWRHAPRSDIRVLVILEKFLFHEYNKNLNGNGSYWYYLYSPWNQNVRIRMVSWLFPFSANVQD